MNPQAEQLNQTLANDNPFLLAALSERAKTIYFPYQGILGQSAAAKGKQYNATIGIACEDDLSPMRLASLSEQIPLPPAKVFPYAPSFGNPELRKTWQAMLTEKNPGLAGKSFSLPVVTQALTHGLSLAGFLFLNQGDEIIVPTPYWDNYNLLFEEGMGARITPFECFEDNTRFNFAALEHVLAERQGKKVVLLLNFPNNPTGYTPLADELAGIAQRLQAAAEQGTQIVVLIDDAYFGLVYEDGVATESIFAQLADSHENILAVKIDGATKEDYVWGFRVGFMTFANKAATDNSYKALADKAGGAIRAMISNCSQLSQSLLLSTYTADDYAAQKQAKYDIMQQRYQVLKQEFSKRPEFAEVFVPLPYNSGYFMCIRPIDGIDVEQLRQLLLDKYDTGIIALQGLVRIAFSSIPASSIPALLDNIYQACKELA